MFSPAARLAALLAIGLAPAAAAQEPALPESVEGERYNMVVVYGEDTCPQSTADVIVVCARKPESERYRVPEALRYSDNPANEAWAERAERLEMAGAFGTLSCSPVGAGGVTGCTQEMIRKAYADKENSSDVRFSAIINDIRAERLSTIDADAAEEQRDVEMIEREYMRKLESERAAPTPDEAPEGTAADPR